MNALGGLALLLLFQVAGEGLTHALALPVPGPVVGLVLMLAGLNWPAIRTPVAETAELLLAHLSLLFVPVGVGVITHLHLVSQYGLQLLVAIVLSTWAGLAVTALVLRRLLRNGDRPMDPSDEGLDGRAERRAAAKPARIPAGDRPMDPSDEGLH